jgi:hypothetical protein
MSDRVPHSCRQTVTFVKYLRAYKTEYEKYFNLNTGKTFTVMKCI